MFDFSTFLRAISVLLLLKGAIGIQGEVDQSEMKEPKVFVVLLARNKAHILPYFLTLFERLEYPKERMSLYIRSDHNIDKTTTILDEWLIHNKYKYHYCNVSLDNNLRGHYPGDVLGTEWSDDRFNNVIRMKEEALMLARHMWADFIWYLDMDVLITNAYVLHEMLNEGKHIVAPMLDSLDSYSNFWGAMSEDYWYKRSEDYFSILRRTEEGCFIVPMVHSFVLVDLTTVASDALTFIPENIDGYDGPNDDIIAFAISAKDSGIDMHVCNTEEYGLIPPPFNDQPLKFDYMQLVDIKLKVLAKHSPLPLSPILKKYTPAMPKKDKAGFEQIYLISLARRPERRKQMYHKFNEVGLSVKLFEAVDGRQLNESYLRQLGVKQMVGYKDPSGDRDLTYGEIGCFLSHYNIWKDIVSHGYQTALVFEDDAAFKGNLRENLNHMLLQANSLVDWDFIYLGRKKLTGIADEWVKGSDTLVHVDYSYWTLCYAITVRGAKKLLDGQPLVQLVPADEYIPMMYNRHPETSWMERFPVRDLKAFSVSPLYVDPSYYTNDEGYVSDTEDSPILEVMADAPSSLETNLEGKGIELGVSGLEKNEL